MPRKRSNVIESRLDEFERLLRARLKMTAPQDALSPLEREVIAEQREAQGTDSNGWRRMRRCASENG